MEHEFPPILVVTLTLTPSLAHSLTLSLSLCIYMYAWHSIHMSISSEGAVAGAVHICLLTSSNSLKWCIGSMVRFAPHALARAERLELS